jgi:hypothetical protein
MSGSKNMAINNGHNGNAPNGHPDKPAPTDPPADMPVYERIRLMREQGWEQTFSTGRRVRLRTLEPDMLLKDGDIPDVLTPLLLRSLYGDDRNTAVKEFMDQPFGTKEDAFAYVEMLNLICAKSICDGTKVEELTLAEKRLVFRFALGCSELLVEFEYKPPPDVASVAQGDDVPSVAEPSAEGERSVGGLVA